MYRYSFYIARHLVHSTLLISLSLTAIVWLTQALRFIDFIVNQGVSVVIFLNLTVLLIPSLFLMVLPPALFCAVIFVYHKLISDSELVVLQAAGLSKWRLARPALIVAGGMTLAAYAISFWVMPLTYRQFKDMQVFLRDNYASILLQEGVFNSPTDGLTVFIRDRERDGQLRGLLVHDNRQPGTSLTYMADAGRLLETPAGPRFLLTDGNRQEMRQGKLSLLNFESYTLDVSLYAKQMGARVREPQEQYLSELYADTDKAPRERAKQRAEAHQRLLWPGYCFCLAMVGCAMLLTGQFNRRGQWQRIAAAVIAALAVMFGAVGWRGMIVQYPAAIPAAYINLLLPMLIAATGLSEIFMHKSAAARRRKATS